MLNRLLTFISEDEWALLAPHLVHIEMPRSFTLCEQDGAMDHVYFMDSGVGSIIVRSNEGLEAEGGLFGRDGVSPIDAVLGSDRAVHRIVVQVGGDGWRLPTTVLKAAMDASADLRGLLLRYVQTLTIQATYTALSNAVHPIDERLARWLLMCDDRTDGGEIHLTHEFLSLMLAVRRPSVTTSLHVLEGNGFIRSERGKVLIRNRHGLEVFAGDAYGRAENEYARLIGDLRPPQADHP